MELQRFYAHLILGLTVFGALGVSEMVSGGERSGKGAGGRGGLPPDRESFNPLRGSSAVPQHLPARDR
jgi:hypothetical protein